MKNITPGAQYMIKKLKKTFLTERNRLAENAFARVMPLKERLIGGAGNFSDRLLLKFIPRQHYLKGMEERTKNLGERELIYLYKYVFQGRTTLYVKLCDETMAVLYTKELTERNTEKFKTIEGYGYDLNIWAREYLEQNKSIFDGCLLHKAGMSKRRG